MCFNFKILFCFSLLVPIAIGITSSVANAQAWVWGSECKPSGIAPIGEVQGTGHAVAADKKGNAFLSGYFGGTQVSGNDTLSGGGAFIIKYDSNGNTLWARQSTGGAAAFSVATDGSGNSYLTGAISQPSVTFGTVNLSSPTFSQMFLVKYDPNGNTVWGVASVPVGANSSSSANDVAADRLGNTFVCGQYIGTEVFGTDTITEPNLSNSGAFLAKYDPNGNFLWVRAGIPKNYFSEGTGYSVAIDTADNVYVTGNFQDTLVFGAFMTTDAYLGGNDMFTIKYNSNGKELWLSTAHLASVNSQIFGNSISVDRNGNAYVTGSVYGVVYLDNYRLNGQSEEACFLKYDTVGNIIWAKQGYNLAGNVGWAGYSVSCDTLKRGGGYIVASDDGNYRSTLKLGVDTFNLFTNAYTGVVFQFDSAGNTVCGSVYEEGGEDDGDGIVVDPSGRYIYMGGDVGTRAIFGPDTLIYPGDQPFMARWKTCCGTPLTISPIDTSICVGASVAINATGALSYGWSPSAGLNTTTGPNVIATPTVTTYYTVTDQNPTCASTAIAAITVSQVPTVVVTPPWDTLCTGSNIVLNSSGNNIGTYTWLPPTGLSCTNCANPSASPTLNVTYTLVASNGGCKRDTAVAITVLQGPHVTLTPSNTICFGDSILLTATGGGTYRWSNNSTNSTIKVSPTSNTNYSVRVKNQVCADSAKTTVTVDAPTISACCNDTITMGSNVELDVTGTGNFVWTPITGLNCANCAQPTASPTVTTTYTVTSNDANNCSLDRTLTVYVEDKCADFTIPNVFTPNNDGINDDLVINVENPSSYNITIYDRWGKQVYTSSHVIEYWNGRINGTENLAPDGTYYYIITASCGTHDYNKKGFVEVVGEK